jgi:hypothetical protein
MIIEQSGASFIIGFTGTPIELQDANTSAVFGDYITVYDIQRAVQDGAAVPIYYKSRLAKLALDEAERPKIDPDFEEATEGEEVQGAARGRGRRGEALGDCRTGPPTSTRPSACAPSTSSPSSAGASARRPSRAPFWNAASTSKASGSR